MSLTGRLIRELRNKSNMTRRELIDKSGVSGTIISKVENGQADMLCRNFWKIVDALGYQVVLRPRDVPVNEERGEERYL